MATGQALNIVTSAQAEQYRTKGYVVLDAVIPPEHLALLREECETAIDLIHKRMDEAGTDTLGINHRNSRYFIPLFGISERVNEFLFSPLMADICRATLGDTAYLFLDQYVVKAAERGMKFSWHQDSGYIPYDHTPYLTCWCTLDPVNEENGTVYVLPYDRAGTRDRIEHVKEAGSNDMVGYFGDDPGDPIIAPAGSIAFFSSTVLHRSGPNLTDKMRRVYLAQYSAEPIMNDDGTKPRHTAEPFLKDGQVVAPVQQR
ncbi:MAG TPA: phytanoyl-CoA dioxygenase family protein [Capsulimonadaceae bacterium]|jgi:ectoine hydroxylase-related dioxygenase (phytanoyl-CoA dioxygenase family)